MKNILVITPIHPYPLISGGHQAIYNGLVALEGIAKVYLLSKTTETQWKRNKDNGLSAALPHVTTLPYIDPNSRHTIKWYWKVLKKRLCNHIPILKEKTSLRCSNIILPIYDIDKDKICFISHIIEKYHIDIVQIEMCDDMRIVEYLPSHIKTIFVHHELRFVRDELWASTIPNLSDIDKQQLSINKKEEIRLLNKYDKVVTLSSIDTEKLKAAGVKVPIFTSFAIINDNDLHFIGKIATRKVLSYVGPQFHTPNYEGIMWFLNNCWQKLCDIDSEFTFQIIGNWDVATIEKISKTYHGVTFSGFVENLGAVLAGTTMIVPLFVGSGIRMKILEAARIGVPVVSTTIGAEGLPLENGKHIFIADDPDLFVANILQLQDSALRDKFTHNTQNVINAHYTLSALRQNRIMLYN